ncbi:MAG: hypothetical protein H6690_00280 [Erysipelotrichaceae bacterium]|nr:hypothetical protein [Erysipelotrichaceae bacterium]
MNSNSSYQSNVENIIGKSEGKLKSSKGMLILSLIAPVLFVIYLIIFVPMFIEYHRLDLVEEWHNYLNSYSSYLFPLFGLVMAICIFSIISMVISTVNKLKYLGVINFITFLLGLSTLFLIILALFPD